MSNYLSYKFEDTKEAASFFDELPLWSAPFGLMLLKYLTFRKSISVVDIGSGTGFPLIELASRLGNSCKVYGVDCWANANDRARQKIEHYKLSNVTIIEKNAESLPFENETIDMVTANLGLNNFEYPEKIFAECHRVLKPGGTFTISTNCFGHWEEMYKIFYESLLEINMVEALLLLKKEEAHRKSLDSVKELFLNAGFVVTKEITEEYEMLFADGTAFLNHHFIKIGWISEWLKLFQDFDVKQIFETFETKLNVIAAKKGKLILSTPCLLMEGIK